jgi:hypothetical protein
MTPSESWKPTYSSWSEVQTLLEDAWELEGTDGPRFAKILIGKPTPFRDPRSGKELHACAFFVEGATKHIVTAVGGGPLNALISACIAIRRIFAYPDGGL